MSNIDYKERSLYNGEIKLVKKIQADGKPAYYVNGKRKSGVTTFIGIKDKSAALTPCATEVMAFDLLDKLPKGISEEDILFAQHLHKTKKEEAANVGTKIHSWIEGYIRAKMKLPGFEMPEMPEDKRSEEHTS